MHAGGGGPLEGIGSVDVKRGGQLIYDPKNVDTLKEILVFARWVCGLKPRTWADADPLVDLLRGVITYITTQVRMR